MIVRIGYVAIALNLPKVTSSSNVTYSFYNKLISDEKKLEKLKIVTLSNLNDLYKILNYNIENQIHFYRITSRLVPLATHPEVSNWNYRKLFKDDFKRIGDLIRKNNMRVDTHPDQFNVINSIKDEVVKNTEKTLMFHVNLFEDIEYPLGKMVIHVGSSQGGKEKSIERFINNFNKFPNEISSKLILENDDKTFNVNEVLYICKKTNMPMVLDVHHHLCNNNGELLENYLEEIFNTWSNDILPPKLHFSSPKEGNKDRKHSEFINPYDFLEFIDKCRVINKDIDIMIEAKKKDLALYKLVEDIKNIRKNIKWIDKSSFEI